MTHARPLRAVAHRLPPHRRRAHGALQLALGPQDGRHLRPPHRGHRPGAQHAGEPAGHPRLAEVARARLGRGAGRRRRARAVHADGAARASTRSGASGSSRARKAYRCYCTKEELDAQRNALKAKDPKAHVQVPGHLPRPHGPAGPARSSSASRRRTTGSVTYVDKVFGEVTTPNSAQQDFVLLRSDGVPLYNFGAVVDDISMGITLVARGRDHMVNTPPQILLYEAFGAKPPEFAHLPMMLAQNGEKLSKRHGAVSVTRVPRAGVLAAGGPELPRALRLVARGSGGLLAGRARRGVRLGRTATGATGSSTRRSSSPSTTST